MDVRTHYVEDTNIVLKIKVPDEKDDNQLVSLIIEETNYETYVVLYFRNADHAEKTYEALKNIISAYME
jgi:hypothetical protein